MADAYGASHTSIYTDEKRRALDSYAPLAAILEAKIADEQLREFLVALLGAGAKIAEALRTALVTVEGTTNTYGDVQLSVDLIADRILDDFALACPLVFQTSSEESPTLKTVHEAGRFIACWDPLDGSSIVDNNWSVGTIVGVWDRSTGLLGATGRQQVTSVVVQYGPRTTALLALDDGTYEFTLQDGGLWICTRERIQIAEESKIFSPANLRAAQDLPGYKALVDHWMQARYTLRYCGGLVPDVCQHFTKRQGVFANPTSAKAPAKLRLVFEAAPFALLTEKAGGSSSDGLEGSSVLDVEIGNVDQRTALCLGSSKEVARFNKLVLQGPH